MEFAFFISVIVIVTIVVTFTERKRQRKKLKIDLANTYGKKPDKKKTDIAKIKNLWNEVSVSYPHDEKIDDVTWNDLDMDEVFKRLNSCASFVGEQELYARLHLLPKDTSHLEQLERHIQFFDKNSEGRIRSQVALTQLGLQSDAYRLPTYMAKIENYRLKGIWIYRGLQLALILSALSGIIFQMPVFYLLAGSIFVINVTLYSIQKYKNANDVESLGIVLNLINTAYTLTKIEELSHLDAIKDIKEYLNSFKKIGYALTFLSQKKDASLSGDGLLMIREYLIGGTLVDFTHYDRVIAILSEHKSTYNKLYRKVGEIDMCIAVASLRKSLPLYTLPEFTKKKSICMTDVYHPLIDKPVYNSQHLNQNCLITGSNASGKSTYIKAIAINVLLAHNIHTCMAKEMRLPPALLITSMAVRDDLMEGESYYIKEIKYLNRIIENLDEDRFIICMIDEILRGTNTEERIAASTAILKYIVDRNCIAVVASHDIELTQLLSADYLNYHFREKLHAKDVAFDYTLYEGASISKNAIKLLEYVGFPQEIIKAARDMVV